VSGTLRKAERDNDPNKVFMLDSRSDIEALRKAGALSSCFYVNGYTTRSLELNDITRVSLDRRSQMFEMLSQYNSHKYNKYGLVHV